MEIEPGWLRNGAEYFGKLFWSWKQPQKSILDPKTEIFIFWNWSFFSFRPKLSFGVTNFKIHPAEYVHMDHTDHFGVR